MVSRKYTGDYRLENVTDKKGRLVTKPVYSGKYYDFDSDGKTVFGIKVFMLVSAFVSICAFLTAFLLNAQLGRHAWVSLPLAVCVFTIAYYCFGVYTLITVTPPFTREQRDKTQERIMMTSVFTAMLSGVSTVGSIITIAIPSLNAADIKGAVFAVCAALICVMNVFSAVKCRKLSTHEVQIALKTD